MSITVINADAIDPDENDKRFYLIAGPDCSFLVYKEYPSFCGHDALDELADYAAEHAPGIMGSVDGEETDHVKELRADGIAEGYDNDGDGFVSDYYVRAGNCSDLIEIPAVIELLTAEEIKAKYNEDLDITEGN